MPPQTTELTIITSSQAILCNFILYVINLHTQIHAQKQQDSKKGQNSAEYML